MLEDRITDGAIDFGMAARAGSRAAAPGRHRRPLRWRSPSITANPRRFHNRDTVCVVSEVAGFGQHDGQPKRAEPLDRSAPRLDCQRRRCRPHLRLTSLRMASKLARATMPASTMRRNSAVISPLRTCNGAIFPAATFSQAFANASARAQKARRCGSASPAASRAPSADRHLFCIDADLLPDAIAAVALQLAKPLEDGGQRQRAAADRHEPGRAPAPAPRQSQE